MSKPSEESRGERDETKDETYNKTEQENKDKEEKKDDSPVDEDKRLLDGNIDLTMYYDVWMFVTVCTKTADFDKIWHRT